MATVYRLLDAGRQFFDDNGDPYAGGQLFTYQAGSSTKKTAYTESTGTTPHDNPIVLDAAGRLPNPVWGTSGAYKLVLAPSTDTDPPASPEWTEDNVSGINDTAASSVDQWVTSDQSPTYVGATSFTLSGDQTTIFHPGRRLKTTNSGGTVYSTIVSSAYAGPNTTVTVVNDSGALDSGLSAVAYGIVSYTNPSIYPARRLKRVLTYSASDTWTKTLPLSAVVVEVIGGGGGGGGVATTAGGEAAVSGGGGGGGYSRKLIEVASLGATETVAVGTGGAGGTAGANSGSAGNTSSFGAHATATGGAGGNGRAAGSTQQITLGGAGGSGASGDVNAVGESGGIGATTGTATSGGYRGRGGASYLGGGPPEAGYSVAGTNATTPGSGGSGAANAASQPARAGGAGATGRVIVWEYT